MTERNTFYSGDRGEPPRGSLVDPDEALAVAQAVTDAPPSATSVLLDLAEVNQMLAWAQHVQTYNLDDDCEYLIHKLERAKTRLEERAAR